jgi:hypothetical protein
MAFNNFVALHICCPPTFRERELANIGDAATEEISLEVGARRTVSGRP